MSPWYVSLDPFPPRRVKLTRVSDRVQIPNEVTDYYLQKVGFECEDVRL